MTNEEAIKAIKANYPSGGYERLCEALDMAIKALQEQKPKSPCELCKWHLQEDDTACWSCNALRKELRKEQRND